MRRITELGQADATISMVVSDIPASGPMGQTRWREGGSETLARLAAVAAMALPAALIAVCLQVRPAETLPGGSSETKVTDSHLPTALNFTPDGRTWLVTSKTGELYVYDGSGNRLANPALDLPVCANSEPVCSEWRLTPAALPVGTTGTLVGRRSRRRAGRPELARVRVGRRLALADEGDGLRVV